MQIPFNHDSMSRFFRMKEREYGLPEGYLMRTAQLESSLDPNAQNPDSSAGGLFQFIDGTARDYGLNDKYNWIEATDAASRLARDNSQRLRLALGREPTAAELYLAHQQGGGGASSLLSNPNALASSVVGGDAVRLNVGNADMTAGDFANQWLNKYDNEAYPMSNQLGPTKAAAAQTPQGRMSKFDTFREDMRIGSDLLGEGIMRELGEGPSETELLRRRLQNERQERIQNIEAGMNVINAEPDFFDVRAEAYPYRQPGPMHPTEVPPDYYDPRGPHQIPDPSSAPLTSPRPQTRVSTSGGETTAAVPAAAPASPNEVEEEERTGFFGKIADVLYPNAEDNDEAKGKLREFLGALGVGLGQMSQGEVVNLNPYFARIAGEKQAAIDTALAAQALDTENWFKNEQLKVSQQNAATNALKAVRSGGGTLADYQSTLEAFPELRHLVTQAVNGNEQAAKEIAKYTVEKAAGPEFTAEGLKALQDYITAPTLDERSRILAAAPANERDKIIDYGGKVLGTEASDPGAVRLGERLYAADPERYGTLEEAYRQAALYQAGKDPSRDPVLDAQNLTMGDKRLEEYRDLHATSDLQLIALNEADKALDKLVENGDELSSVDKIGLTVGKVFGSMFGTAAAQQIQEWAGVDAESYQQLSFAQVRLMRALAKSFEGQGPISDQEREQMAKEVVSPDLSTARAVELAGLLRAEALVVQANAAHYRNNLDRKNYNRNWNQLDGQIQNSSRYARNIMQAASNYAHHQYMMDENTKSTETNDKDSYVAKYGPEGSQDSLNNYIIPAANEAAAAMYYHALPVVTIDGEEKRAYRDAYTDEIVYLDMGREW